MRWIWGGIAALLVLAACVTINVYFPAAAAEKAADKFINGVIGESAAETTTGGWVLNLSPIASAHAQANLDIDAPAVRAVQQRMSERFSSTLEAHFNSGAIGLTNDGLVALRDASAVPLPARAKLNAAIAEENKDRNAVYREIAVANGHPEWEAEIRQTFARRWVDRAREGWYYQDANDAWLRKGG